MDLQFISELLSHNQSVAVIIMMSVAITVLFRQYIKKEEVIQSNAHNYMARMEAASCKYESITEKMLHYQAEDTKAKTELANAMTMQAQATESLGKVVRDGLDNLGQKIDDARNQIVAHIDINEKKK